MSNAFTCEELAAHLEDQANSRNMRDGYHWTVAWNADRGHFVFTPHAPRIRFDEVEGEDATE